MKDTNNMVKILIGAMLALFTALPALAFDDGYGVIGDHCKVKDRFDPEDGRRSISVRTAVRYANKTGQDQRCQQSITIEDDISMTKPLVIEIRPQQDNYIYPIQGRRDGEEGSITLDFNGLRDYDGEGDCAISIEGGNYITIKDIRLQNIPDGFHGICFGANTHDVSLDNVTIDTVDGGHAIVFGPTSSNNRILPGVQIRNVQSPDFAGIQSLNSGTQAFNQIIPIALEPGDSANSDGLADLGEGAAGAARVHIFSIQSDMFVSSSRNLRVRIDRVQQVGGQGSTRFKVFGTIVEAAEGADVCTAEVYQGTPGVERIQVYSVQPGGVVPAREASEGEESEGEESEDEPAFSLGEGAFFNFVMERASGSTGNGITVRGSGRGEFKFEIDVPRAGDMLVLVPEMTDHGIAGSSKAVVLEHNDDGECGGRTGGDYDLEGLEGNYLISDAILSETQCGQQRGEGTGGLWADIGPIADVDSDGDGVPDVLEDSNGNCFYDEGDLSDWTSPDSDGDGILDGREIFRAVAGEGQVIPVTVYNRDLISSESLPRDGQFCGVLINDEIHFLDFDPCDKDGDGIPNPRDEDSDNDGLKDYEEDRRRFINPWASIVRTDPKGVETDCTLGGTAAAAGKEWKVYRWNPSPAEGEAALVEHHFDNYRGETLPSGVQLIKVACASKGLERTDLNGNWDQNGVETDPYHPDTDRDGWCDGAGTFCTEEHFEELGEEFEGVEDNCPTTPDSSNNCAPSCQEGEDLYRICSQNRDRTCANLYLNFSGDEPTSLKLNSDGVAALYQIADLSQLYTICGDNIDRDGIPDCVERMNPQCRSDVAGTTLNPNKKDTDGDGVEDRIDINPFVNVNRQTNGEGDLIGNVNDSNRESLRNVLEFAQIPILRCFVDRDDDGLTDCQEDSNMNDDYEPTTDFVVFQAVLAGGSYVESDPLNKDSDGDTLDDKLERDTLRTNPGATDTDGDNLSDRTEVVGSTLGNYSDRSGARCVDVSPIVAGDAYRSGTNPADPDTDHDGLKDDIELSCEFVSLFDSGGNLRAGIDFANFSPLNLCSDPLAADSDSDGIRDIDEIGSDGLMQRGETSPCDSDQDSDEDGLSDIIELFLGTLPNEPDTDNDSLKDGEEDDGDGNFNPELGETNPLVADTDGDGLSDGTEVKTVHTNPNERDSDGDGLEDGIELSDPNRLALGEDVRPSLSYIAGLHTDPSNPDTDGDGLCDGRNSVTNGGLTGDVTCRDGEDRNRDGFVNVDDQGRQTETDPRNPDTDGDGIDDRTEICTGGQCNFAANIGHATQGAPSGCFSLAPVAPLSSGSMLYVYGLVLLLNRSLRRKFRK